MTEPSAALSKLSAGIQSFLDSMPSLPPFDKGERMLAVETKLRGSIQPGSSLGPKYQCRAVAAFHEKGADRLTRREVRALCAALNHACPGCGDSSLMLAKPDVVYELFSRFRRAFKEKSLGIENWYDLLQSYLNAKDRTVCCEMLRDLLAETLPEGVKQYPFSWLAAMAANRELLNKEPCKASASDIIKGQGEKIEVLRKDLSIPDTSWFWRELTLARAEQAVLLDDAGFAEAVPSLLQAAHFLPERLRDKLIRDFLDRCVTCQDAAAREEVQSFAVECWRAPPPGAHVKYDSISPEARQMVQEGLLRADLKSFMELLQIKGADERKLAFWSRYTKAIEYHRILLGNQAHHSPQLEIAQLRARPTVGKLGGNVETNNALLLKVGGWVLVESGGREAPLLGYKAAKLPFNLEGEEPELPCFRKGNTADLRLDRKDTLEGQWEDKLTAELATLGVRRDEGATAKKKSPAPPPAPVPTSATKPLDTSALMAFIQETRLQAEDTRSKGGAFWIVGDLKDNYYAAQKLAGWGFRWKAGRGWWRS